MHYSFTDHFQQLIKKKLHSPSPLVHPFVLLLRLYEATLLSNDSLSLFLSLSLSFKHRLQDMDLRYTGNKTFVHVNKKISVYCPPH